MTLPGEALHADLDGGWQLPPPAAREPIHTRSIVCRSFRRDDGLLEIDARFIDTRPFAYDSEFRGACAPGVALHNMQLRVSIDRERRVAALVSAMAAAPYDSCAGVNPNFQRVVGPVGLQLGGRQGPAARQAPGGAGRAARHGQEGGRRTPGRAEG
jgi:hypothetical protein